MTKENDEYLVKKYPKLFINRDKDMTESCMFWGFECSDNWFWLIDNLCNSIQSYIDNNSHNNISQVTVDQVKEKYGGLRFYFSGGDRLIEGMVWLAENLSYHICEDCGSTKNVKQTKGWIFTLCDECIVKRKKVPEEN